MNHTKHWNEITAVYENKDFNCDQCGKYFARGCNLKVHIQIVHENEKKFICQICKKDLSYYKP